MKAIKKALWLISIFLLYPLLSTGQQSPAFRQFYFNPYLFNPAFAGINGYTEVSVFYRQQWVGFNDAPAATGFSLQYPTQNRASFGLNFISQEAVVLRTTSSQATFAYRLPLAADHFLLFGLSGVVGFTNLNLDADYSNDPTILNAAASTVYGDANVGLVYEWRALRVGFALPKLFGQTYYSPQDLVDVRYAQFRNQLYSASYKIRAGHFSIEPYALFRLNRDLQNWWEAATLVYYKEKIWIGGSYHNTQGLGFFIGMDVKEKLRVAYSFELPPVNKDFTSVNSHEVQLQLKIGNKRMFKWAKQSVQPVKPEPISAKAEEQAEIRSKVIADQVELDEKPELLLDSPVMIEKAKEEDVDTVQNAEATPAMEKKSETVLFKQADPLLAKGYYIIVGSFRLEDNALMLQQQLTVRGFTNVGTGRHFAGGNYYVYVFTSSDRSKVSEVLPRFTAREETKSAWILGVK